MSHNADGGRLVWIDANRFYAACGVVMIHCSTDTAGGPFSNYEVAERFGPALLRSVATISSSELFLLFSLFLIALKIDKREPTYSSVIRIQIERLIVPLIAWTLFYAFFRLMKASAFGYEQAIASQLTQWDSWVEYLLLGSAQYHLHFLPTMFFLVLLYPAMRAAIRYPLLALAALPLLYTMNWLHGWLWGNIPDPDTRDYLVRIVKVLGYTSYGLASFALYGIWKRGLDRNDCRNLFWFLAILAVMAFMAKVAYVGQSAMAGKWLNNQGASLFAHLLLPIFVFAMFLMSQYRDWSPRFSKIARLTYGVYLIHPACIDIFDVSFREFLSTQRPIFVVTVKYLFVLPLAFALVYLISRTKYTAWIVGVGPVPLLSRFITGHPGTHRQEGRQ